MQQLISKVQYNNFEAGEFVDIKERNHEETITLIEGFPWNKQRENFSVSLTNPSITIEGTNSDYLKIALYYNGKYVIYYLEDNGSLFTKSFERLESIYEYIKVFFEKNNVDTTGFKKTTNSLSKIIIYFRTQDFVYTFSYNNRFKLFSYFYMFIVGILTLFILKAPNNIDNLHLRIFLKLFFISSAVFFIGYPILTLYNHYIYSKNKILIISKANPIFYFGDLDNPKAYNKKDIVQIFSNNRYRDNGTKLRIEFNNNEIIEFSLLLLAPVDLEYTKFPECSIIKKYMHPFLKWTLPKSSQ
jgi:hypothetical protein